MNCSSIDLGCCDAVRTAVVEAVVDAVEASEAVEAVEEEDDDAFAFDIDNAAVDGREENIPPEKLALTLLLRR